MLFLDTPPDTLNYMIAGYVVVLVVLTVYLTSLFVRWRNLRQELDLLEEMGHEKK